MAGMLRSQRVNSAGPAEEASRPNAAQLGALAFGVAFPALLTAVYFVGLAGAPRPVQQGVYLAGKALQFGLPAAWFLRGPSGLRRLGMPSTRGALLGVAFGLAVFLAALALYHGVLVPLRMLEGGPTEAVRAKVASFGVIGPWRFLALGTFYSLLHSAAEELYWRGFVFGELRRTCQTGAAVLGSGLAFSAHHVILLAVFFGWGSPLTWALSLAVAVGGAFWAWLYQRTGSLVGPWLGHLMIDAAIFTVGWDLVR
jgi:membrane protease YdiL (CAAX protease family)